MRFSVSKTAMTLRSQLKVLELEAKAKAGAFFLLCMNMYVRVSKSRGAGAASLVPTGRGCLGREPLSVPVRDQSSMSTCNEITV